MTKTLDLITIGRSSVDLCGDRIGGRLEDMIRAPAESLAGRLARGRTGVSDALRRAGSSAGARARGGRRGLGRTVGSQSAK